MGESQLSTLVRDLRDPDLELRYSLPPREAVRNAYAQFEKKDFNTWDYAKYDSLVQEGDFTVWCGHYSAFKY